MRKFASLVISGSMVSSVIMQLCNHVSLLDSVDVINETHWLQVRRFRKPVSISLITLQSVCSVRELSTVLTDPLRVGRIEFGCCFIQSLARRSRYSIYGL